MQTTVGWTLACAGVLALVLPAEAISAEWLVNPRVCERTNLSEESQAYCNNIVGLSGRALYKATVLENLRRTNQPPVADLEVERVLPRRVDLDVSGATDEDGSPVHYTFQLFDGDTGEIVAGPVTTRESHASLESHQDLPPNLRASVIVEDDERATDTIELAISLGATTTNCSSTFFACSTSSGQTTCAPTAANSQFSTDDLLDAAQRCDLSLSKATALIITAAGGKGGKGSDVWPFDGGSGGKGGAARMGTTLTHLDNTYGSPDEETTYCYGLGQSGGHGDTYSAAGGAATLLRTCQNVSQTTVTGVLLIAGGGGGGGAANLGSSGHGGGRGGIATSSTGGPVEGAGNQGGGTGGHGGTGGDGGVGAVSGSNVGTDGADGVGGKGGPATDWGTAGFTQGNPQVTGNSGQGASQEKSGGGAGGGGYGGGGSGITKSNGPAGGGGGGSYAATSSISAGADPSSNGGSGYLQFSFQP